MTSIHTNSAAIAALQTLRSIGSRLEKSQYQVSSGLRVETASDNAAYWSIATTMRSDGKALSAIADDLGLGAAKVDVAYNGLNAAQDVLTEFQARLVAAKEPGIDRAKVQTELDQLKQQLKSIASSSSFNGVNWLDTDRTEDLADLASLPSPITASFVRSADGSVAAKQIDVDAAKLSLFNAGGGGALQGDARSLGTIGGFRNANISRQGGAGYEGFTFTGPLTLGVGDTIDFDIDVDGGSSYHVTIDKAIVAAALGTTSGVVASTYDYSAVLNSALTAAGIPARATWNDSSRFSIYTLETTGLPGSSISVSNAASSLGSNAGGLENAPYASLSDDYPYWTKNFTGPFTVYRQVAFSFDIQVDGNTPEHVTVDRDLVDNVLGTTDGVVSNATDMAAILDAALAGKGLTVSANEPLLRFDIDPSIYPDAGRKSSFRVWNVTDNLESEIGPQANFNILDVDIADPNNSLDNYIYGVDAMLKRVIDGATSLGAIQSHAQVQASLVDTLIDNLTKGVGRLVDADMNEASTRIKALATQQQLAIQSLQIANGDAENILQLFRQ